MNIFLDNAATTKPLYDTPAYHSESGWYNPSAAYAPSEAVHASITQTRKLLLRAVGLKNGGCVITSGGTEANNMSIMSAFKPGAHYITSAIEHPSVYEVFKYMERQGAIVEYIKPRGFRISANDVARQVRRDTALVSIMHVNNETGALNDIGAICAAVKAKNSAALFHSDGVQALHKTSVCLTSMGPDTYSVSAHKIHGLKGTGALLYKKGTVLKPLLFGGGQEGGLRPGTENTIGIQSLDAALRLGGMDIDYARKLHDELVRGMSAVPDTILHMPEEKVPHIICVSFEGVRAEVLVRLLGSRGIYIGSGAACSRGKVSRVLLECGVPRSLAESAVRISLCRHNTQNEIEIFTDALKKAVKQLRL